MDPSFYSSCVWDKESLGISRAISENSGTFEHTPQEEEDKVATVTSVREGKRSDCAQKRGLGWIKGGFTVDELAKKSETRLDKFGYIHTKIFQYTMN